MRYMLVIGEKFFQRTNTYTVRIRNLFLGERTRVVIFGFLQYMNEYTPVTEFKVLTYIYMYIPSKYFLH